MIDEVVTGIGTPNIALVKYWGRRNSSLNLPTNSSLSITLDETLNTKTSVLFSDKLKSDALYINGELQNLNDHKNEKSVFAAMTLDRMRGLAGIKYKALIVSKNSFPTSGGLASSASGAATLVYTVSMALDLNMTQKEMSINARQISGSACRSLFGGFVAWRKGEEDTGLDSYAECVADQNHWPEVIDVIALVSGAKKKISSSDGHRVTVETSKLYNARPNEANARVVEISKAVRDRDFETLARITMADSNSMHALMLDSYPPIIYLNDVSKQIIYAVHELNEREGSSIAAYTFDAGPNAQIITLKKHKDKVVECIKDIVGTGNIIVAGQGTGPRSLSKADSLIDEQNAKPG